MYFLSKVVKNVGVWLDENINMEKKINSLVSHCYKILKDNGKIKNDYTRYIWKY